MLTAEETSLAETIVRIADSRDTLYVHTTELMAETGWDAEHVIAVMDRIAKKLGVVWRLDVLGSA